MFCRRISSYILLVIIVLSIPRSSITVNSEEAIVPNRTSTFEDMVFSTKLFNILIDVESVRTSEEAVEMMTRLSPILKEFYETLKSAEGNDNLMRIRSTQSLQLLAANIKLCKKIDNPQNAESVKAELWSFANQCKQLCFSSNSIGGICDGECAASLMTQLTVDFLWLYSTTEQFKMLFEIIEYLAPKCINSEAMTFCTIRQLLFILPVLDSTQCPRMLNIIQTLIHQIKTSENASLLTESFTGAINSHENLNSNHVSEILLILQTLITQVNTSEDIPSVIQNLEDVIFNRFISTSLYMNEGIWLLTPDQLHLVLLMLQCLVQ